MFTEVVNQKTKKAQSILSVVLICAQEDEKYAESIGKQISASGNRVDYFSNRMLKGGSNEKLEVISRINSADLIFILLSPDFACQLADDESKESEYLSEAKTRHESQNGSIIPIRVRACEWEHLLPPNIKSLPEGEQVLAELKPAKLDRAILNIIKRTFKEKKLNRGFYTSPIIANNHASLIRSFRQIFPSGLLIKLGLSIVLFSIWIMSCLNWYYSEKNRIDDLDIKFRRISIEEEYLELRLKAFDDEDSRIYHKERKKQCNFTTNSSSDSKQWCKFETDYGALGKEKIAKERAAISSKKKSTEESLIKEKSNFNRSKKEFVGHVMIGGITNLIQIFTGSHHR